MRTAPILLAGLVGFAVGLAAAWPGRHQLREDLDDARKALAAMGPGIWVQSPKEVQIETVALPAAAVPAVPPAPVPAMEEPPDAPPQPFDPERFGRGRRGDDPSRDTPEAREARRQAFVERLRERSDTARTEFVARAALDEAQATQLDTVVFDLNQSVESIVADWVSYIRETGTFDTDFRIRFAHDLTSAVIAAYDVLDESLPETWRASAEDFDLARMIDPEVLHPMMELQRDMGVHGGGFIGMLMGGDRGGPRRGPGGTTGGGDAGGGRNEAP